MYICIGKEKLNVFLIISLLEHQLLNQNVDFLKNDIYDLINYDYIFFFKKNKKIIVPIISSDRNCGLIKSNITYIKITRIEPHDSNFFLYVSLKFIS